MYETAQTSAWRRCRVIRVRADLGLERNDIRLIYIAHASVDNDAFFYMYVAYL